MNEPVDVTTPADRAPIYVARGLPIFQNCTFVSRAEARNCARGDVILVQDETTGLVANRAFDPALMQYGPEYQNEQAFSAAFKAHLAAVTAIVERHFRGRSLIEVGCGKGFFLEWLSARGFEIVGMDPAYEGSNARVVKEYFRPGSRYSADGIVLRHVLEHVPDPIAFLATIRDANRGRGSIYIEVPCFDWIRERRAFFDIFYEHVNYFRLDDLRRMFGSVHEAGRSFGDQYIYVVAELASLRTPAASAADRVRLPEDFLALVETQSALVSAAQGRGAAIWGGASKGVIFAAMMERAGALPDLVIDINPAKQGRYLPVTGLKVHAPEEAIRALPATASIFVMNGNYLGEIRAATHDRFRYVCIDATAAG
jgi:hypothetical protein